jgi:hypothetical protein
MDHLISCAMKQLIILLGILFFYCCGFYPHLPSRSKFIYTFPGQLENLEDAFYASKFQYAELDFDEHWQRNPEYEFKIVRSDTTIWYAIELQNCVTRYYLVYTDTLYKCDLSYLSINRYRSNFPDLPLPVAESIFHKEIIDPLMERINTVKNSYHTVIEKKPDSTFVKILDQNNGLRKLYSYSKDSTGRLAEKEFINYLGDSTIIYLRNPQQMHVYLKSKTVIRKE